MQADKSPIWHITSQDLPQKELSGFPFASEISPKGYRSFTDIRMILPENDPSP
jgi:hypothetical protein